MARIKGGMNAKRKHNRVLKLAKGYRGARSKQYRVAKQSVMRALTSAYAGRKERKRQFRQLWIARINAAARLNGLSYSKFMYGLKLAGVEINRKMLAELAVNDAEGFKTLAELAKSKVAESLNYVETRIQPAQERTFSRYCLCPFLFLHSKDWSCDALVPYEQSHWPEQLSERQTYCLIALKLSLLITCSILQASSAAISAGTPRWVSQQESS